jgi:hypothetical protein
MSHGLRAMSLYLEKTTVSFFAHVKETMCAPGRKKKSFFTPKALRPSSPARHKMEWCSAV